MSSNVDVQAKHTSATDLLSNWRMRMLDILLLSTFLIGLAVTIVVSAGLLRDQSPRAAQLIPIFIGCFVLLGLITFVRRLPYILRAGVLTAIFYGLACMNLAQNGLGGEGRIFLITAATLSALLFGRRFGFAAALISTVTIGLIGALFVQGFLDLSGSTRATSITPTTWVTAILLQFLMTLLLITATGYLLARLVETLDATEQQARNLQTSEALLVQQTRSLEAQTTRLTATETMLRDLVKTLETPIVRLSRTVLLAPLMGTIDAQRAATITQRLLSAATLARSQLVIIDISGVGTVDDATVKALIDTTHALRLVGCRVTLTGIAPDVAITLSRLDVDLSNLQTARSPEQVLEREALQLQEPVPTPML